MQDRIFELPKEEATDAVCVDVMDLGQHETSWGMKHQVELVFELGQLKTSGYRHIVRKRSNLCFHEMATLAKDIQSWLGRDLADRSHNLTGLRSLIGRACRVEIKHNKSGDKTYANIVSILPPGSSKLSPSGSYRTKEQWAEYNRSREVVSV